MPSLQRWMGAVGRPSSGDFFAFLRLWTHRGWMCGGEPWPAVTWLRAPRLSYLTRAQPQSRTIPHPYPPALPIRVIFIFIPKDTSHFFPALVLLPCFSFSARVLLARFR